MSTTDVATLLVVVVTVIVAGVFRHLMGQEKTQRRMMLAETLGGLSLGVLVAYPISNWLKTDVSVISACLGLQVGWTMSWLFARRVKPVAS